MSVFQALTLAIAFAMLVIEILNFNHKNNRPMLWPVWVVIL